MTVLHWTRRNAGKLSALLALAVVLAANSAPSQEKTPSPQALARIMKFAPAGAVGAAYLDVAAVRDKFDVQITKAQRQELGPGQAMLKFTKKVDWAAMWFPQGFERDGPLFVLHGTLTAGDMKAFVKTMDRGELTFQKRGNGRYDAKGQPTFIVGSEADDVPAGIVLMANKKLLTDAFVAGLGKTKPDALDKLLGSINTAAPLWLALSFPSRPDEQPEVRSISASAYPLGEKATQITVVCAEEEPAEGIAQAILGAERATPALKGLSRVTRDGGTVQIQIKPDRSLPHKLVAALIQARRLAREAASMANLNMIAKAIWMYAAEQMDRVPSDLGALEKYLGSAKVLVSPLSGRKPPKFEKGKLIGETDYLYILVVVKPTGDAPKRLRLSQIQEPSKFVLAYERPENYGKRGTAVAFLDGHVEFMSPKAFHAALEYTRKELKRIGW